MISLFKLVAFFSHLSSSGWEIFLELILNSNTIHMERMRKVVCLCEQFLAKHKTPFIGIRNDYLSIKKAFIISLYVSETNVEKRTARWL